MGFTELPEEGSGGLRLNPRDILNHLLLVWVIDYIEHSPTQYSRPDKPSDVIIVDAVDLDGVNDDGSPGVLVRKCWWRQAKIIQSLRRRLGVKEPLLVRMGKGAGSIGFAAPFILTSMTSDPGCVSRANAWLAQNRDFVPSEPGYPMPAPPTTYNVEPDRKLPPVRPATAQEESMLERMARGSLPRSSQTNQGNIPF
jgi:hypothetical protein